MKTAVRGFPFEADALFLAMLPLRGQEGGNFLLKIEAKK